MKTTDNTQNKQLSELSDEELKKVTGGSRKVAVIGSVASVRAQSLSICPEDLKDENGNCTQK